MAQPSVKNGFAIARRELPQTQSALYRKIRALEAAGTALPKALIAEKRRLERAADEATVRIALRYRGETFAESGIESGAGAVQMNKFVAALMQSAPRMDAALLLENAETALARGKSADAALYKDAQVRVRLKLVIDAKQRTHARLIVESMKKSVRGSMSSEATTDLKLARKWIARAVALLQKAAERYALENES
ncbi:hypothetical protein J5226_22330 [Lysobacter sp. K5869]|uniref:hypothetical protein n=1 Tax=Lysobacter sp. K5869 TaxID=2820808 RepID=UPI001C06029C|nr:hypothetical protein [Lysobacter sp. K5869]QWP76293.1 hypothetical protein J5226_22330 [Lysobacter sp. K5869]